jgi:hypothetical protein
MRWVISCRDPSLCFLLLIIVTSVGNVQLLNCLYHSSFGGVSSGEFYSCLFVQSLLVLYVSLCVNFG